jgi:DNA-binding CsgD family transcriptional regulator
VAVNATRKRLGIIFRSSSGAGEVVAIRRSTYVRTVARLSGSDYRGILEFLRAAGEVERSDPFPEQVLARLRELVPCDTVSYGNFDRHGHVWRTGVRYSGEPRAPVTPAIHEAHGRLAYQYPYRPWSPEATRALRWSDLLSRREWHALDLYWEVCRALDSEYELELWLATPDGVAGGFGFDSFKRDFSERDKLVLETLQPHLVQLWRNAAARKQESRSLAILTPREREILLWVARGKSNREIAGVLYLALGTIRKHLDNVYDKLGVSNRAGAVGRAFSIETENFADQSAESRSPTRSRNGLTAAQRVATQSALPVPGTVPVTASHSGAVGSEATAVRQGRHRERGEAGS